jgi:sugar phosphate permease
MDKLSSAGSPCESMSSYRWIILAVLTVTQTGASLAALSFGPLAPFLQETFSINRAQVGLLTSSLYMGSILVSIPSGRLADLLGIRQMLLVGPALMGLFFLAISRTGSYPLLWFLALCTGMGYGVINPATAKAIIYWFAARGRATALGVKQSGVTAGAALAAVMLPALALSFSLHTAIALVGIVILVLAFFCYALNRNFPVATPEKGVKGGARGLRHVFLDRNLMQASFADSLWSAVQLSVSTYLVLYLTENLAFPVVLAGTCLAVAQITAGGGRVVWGMISDHLFSGRRKIVLVLIGAITTFTTLAMILFTEKTPDWLLYANVALIGFSVVGRHGVTMAFIAELAGTELAGTATGVYVTIAYMGIIVGPPFFGYIVDTTGSYPLAWLIFGAASAVATGIMHLVKTAK